MLRTLGVVFAALVLCGAVARADTLVMSNGQRLEGKLLSRDSSTVRFEVHRSGKISIVSFDANDVDKVIPGALEDEPRTQTASAGKPIPVAQAAVAGAVGTPLLTYSAPTYYIIPMKGEVGVTMTADLLARSMADAALRKPTVVVLEVDSPGGAVDEVSKMVEVLAGYKGKLRVVALVHRAISAAAITTLAVEQIYMRRTAVIGAATAFKINVATGLPEDIGEKFASIWRASARSSAEVGGHSKGLAEGMIDATVTLYKTTENGKPTIVETVSPGDGAKQIKEAGKLLTMTADEAIDATLAVGIADDEAGLGKALGYDGWVECVGLGVPLAKYYEDRLEDAKKKCKALVLQFQSELKNARANDPSTFRDYMAFKETGQLTPDSRENWEERSARCAAALSRAEQQLDRIAAVAKEFPMVLGDPDQIARFKASLDEVRTHIIAQSHR